MVYLTYTYVLVNMFVPSYIFCHLDSSFLKCLLYYLLIVVVLGFNQSFCILFTSLTCWVRYSELATEDVHQMEQAQTSKSFRVVLCLCPPERTDMRTGCFCNSLFAKRLLNTWDSFNNSFPSSSLPFLCSFIHSFFFCLLQYFFKLFIIDSLESPVWKYLFRIIKYKTLLCSSMQIWHVWPCVTMWQEFTRGRGGQILVWGHVKFTYS